MRVTTRTLFVVLSLAAAAVARAGNVTAQISGGRLTITGSDQADFVGIDMVNLPDGSVRLFPANGATLNGSPNAQILNGLSGDVAIDLRGGADMVDVEGSQFPGAFRLADSDLFFNSSNCGGDLEVEGCDYLELHSVTIAGRLALDSGDGDDDVNVIKTSVASDALIRLGADGAHDRLKVEKSTFGALLKIVGGDGDDDVTLTDVGVNGDLRVVLRGGTNSTEVDGVAVDGLFRVKGNDGDDAFYGGDVTASALHVELKNGVNVVAPSLVHVAHEFTIRGGMDVDVVGLTTVNARDLDVRLGGGDDVVAVFDGSSVHDTTIYCALGDDLVSLDEYDTGHDLAIGLGIGDDSFQLKDSQVGDDLRVTAGAGDDEVHVQDSQVTDEQEIDPGTGNDVIDA